MPRALRTAFVLFVYLLARKTTVSAIKLGEAIAIGILQEQNLTYNEDYYLTLTKFDGSTITIGR